MKWLWTWGGRCFGYRDEDNLWTYDGKHVGRFVNNEVYAPNGAYLGEITDNNRLITDIAKKNRHSTSFTPDANRMGYVKYVDYVGYVMLLGYEDFPKIEGKR